MAAPCTLILRIEEYSDHSDKFAWDCELDPTKDSESGSIISFTDRTFPKDRFESGVSTLFGDVTITRGKATINGNPSFGRRDDNSNQDRRLLAGDRSVLAVRVVAPDISTTASAATISDEIFGTSGDAFNLKSGFSDCSYDVLNFLPTTDSRATNGVYTVTMTENIGALTNSELQNKVVNQLTAELGTLNTQFNHVMLCLPPITGFGGIAYAYINSWLSVYKDNWCNYPSAQLHEIGHNIGLAHSGEGTQQYADQSGMMGYSYSSDEGPKMCFNNAKNWQLGWYADKRTIATPLVTAWSGDLVGISDYGAATTQSVILKVEGDDIDYYVGFNRQAGINSGTREAGNLVTVQSRALGTNYAQSTLIAKLGAGQSYAITNFGAAADTVYITVDSINLTGTPAVASIRVYKDSVPTATPTASPTGTPTASPTASPTISSKPSSMPTVPPTKNPTASPTAFPTRPPIVGPDCPSIGSAKVCKGTPGCEWAGGRCRNANPAPAPTPTAPTPTAPTPTGGTCSSYTPLGGKACREAGCNWSKGVCVDP